MFHLMLIKPDSRVVRAPVVTMETVQRALVRMISSRSLKIELSNAALEIFPFFRNLICTLFCRLRNATYPLSIIFLLKSRGYYMAARRYEIYLLMLKNTSYAHLKINFVSLRGLVIFSICAISKLFRLKK